MTRALLLAAAAAAGLAFSTAAQADGHADPAVLGAIAARQHHMELYQFNLVILGSMAQGRTEYNADMASAAASNLVALTQLNQMAYWPPGSDNAALPEDTRAQPGLWENFPDVIEKSMATVAAAEAMAEAAGTDLAALQAAMGALGGACTDCHRAYRAR